MRPGAAENSGGGGAPRQFFTQDRAHDLQGTRLGRAAALFAVKPAQPAVIGCRTEIAGLADARLRQPELLPELLKLREVHAFDVRSPTLMHMRMSHAKIDAVKTVKCMCPRIGKPARHATND